MFVSVLRQRDLGVPLISLNALTGHRSTSRRLQRPYYHAVAGRGTGFRRLSGGCVLSPTGDWDSTSSGFAVSHGSLGAPFHTPEHGHRFSGMLLSPSLFRSRLVIGPKNLPPSFFPAEPEIGQSASWRTSTARVPGTRLGMSPRLKNRCRGEAHHGVSVSRHPCRRHNAAGLPRVARKARWHR